MPSWKTLLTGGPRPTDRPVLTTDHERANLWRFEALHHLGRVVGYRWVDGWSAEWRVRQKVAPGGLFAFYNFDTKENVIGLVRDDMRRIALIRLGDPATPRWVNLPKAFHDAQLDSTFACHVPGQGIYVQLNPKDGAGATLLIDASGCHALCRGPHMNSLAFDAQLGLVGGGDATFRYDDQRWVSLSDQPCSSVAAKPNGSVTGLVAFGANAFEGAFGDPSGRGAEGVKCMAQLESDGWTALETAPMLPAEGNLAPLSGSAWLCVDREEMGSQTSVWRDELTTFPALHGCAAEAAASFSGGVLAADATSHALFRFHGKTWVEAHAPLGRRTVLAVVEEDELIFVLTEDGVLHLKVADATFREVGALEIDPHEPALMVWDSRGERLLIQPSAGGTWAFDGQALAPLAGPALPASCDALCGSPVGVYALVEQKLFLLRDGWFEVDMFAVPAPVNALFFDPARGLITCGEKSCFVLTAHGWERFCEGPADAAFFAYDVPTSTLLAFRDPWEPNPAVHMHTLTLEETHPLPVNPRSSSTPSIPPLTHMQGAIPMHA